jgi:hypothetical protein
MEASGQLHDQAALPQVHIIEKAGWAPESVWILWGREKLLHAAGNRTPPVEPVAVATEVSRFLSRLLNGYESVLT